jgi:hypothetical protein
LEVRPPITVEKRTGPVGIAQTYQELRKLNRDELIVRYDALAANTVVGLDFYREEIARRTHDEQTAEMLSLTRAVWRLTWLITILTIANVVAVILPLVR